MSELRQQMAEQEEIETKANVVDTIITLLNNAICYMTDNGMSKDEVAEYIGTSTDILDAIDEEDFEKISNLINKEKES